MVVDLGANEHVSTKAHQHRCADGSRNRSIVRLPGALRKLRLLVIHVTQRLLVGSTHLLVFSSMS